MVSGCFYPEVIKIDYMEYAVNLAKKAIGFTNPNPLVGAVIVKDGEIIGEGFHEKYGSLHAERNALKNCLERGNSPNGAEMYVTLEPCCHHGKQPPCTEAVVQSGIAKVYIGSYDPNPLVSGKGIAYLREHGIEVIENYKREMCDKLNPVFFKFITTGMPYITVKIAKTIDGFIATKTGNSKWITGEASRLEGHKLRKSHSGILVGINTVLADNPMLDCRCENPSNPTRIVCDSLLKMPTDCNLIATAGRIPVIIACTNQADRAKKAELENMGVKILEFEGERVPVQKLFKKLGEMKIDSVLVEGGAEMTYSVVSEGLADKIVTFTAPKIFGGKGKNCIGGEGVEKACDAFEYKCVNIRMIGEDIMAEYERK